MTEGKLPSVKIVIEGYFSKFIFTFCPRSPRSAQMLRDTATQIQRSRRIFQKAACFRKQEYGEDLSDFIYSCDYDFAYY